ncbi:MAG: hybrid sensor histidine kinase/response regulator [Candidatus Riflebacteria bacterium]|nr:hybrid sensor histidine kinase/response regulator [Candidatus Riflebacteria bacterium]
MDARSGTARILVVDDMPENLRLLNRALTGRGYVVEGFRSGKKALEAAFETPPDLILLDISMPAMDGYTVCDRLKADERTRQVPVIFLSGHEDTNSKVMAFRHGGVDYVVKPFALDEVFARVETHLRLNHLHAELESHNQRLEVLVAERTRQLMEANERLAILDRAKSDFLNLISHELRTPLNGVLGVAELLFTVESPEKAQSLRKLFDRTRERFLTILDDALLLTKIGVAAERFQGGTVPLQQIMLRALDQAGHLAESRRVELASTGPLEVQVNGDADLLSRALASLIETAVKFTVPDQTVRVSSRLEDGAARIEIEGKGRTIPADALGRFFDVLSIAEPITPGGDLGLAPPVAQRILSLFHGSVGVRNDGSEGIRLEITLKTGVGSPPPAQGA